MGVGTGRRCWSARRGHRLRPLRNQGGSRKKTICVAERGFRVVARIRKRLGRALASGTAAYRYELERRRASTDERHVAAGGKPARNAVAVQLGVATCAARRSEQTGDGQR